MDAQGKWNRKNLLHAIEAFLLPCDEMDALESRAELLHLISDMRDFLHADLRCRIRNNPAIEVQAKLVAARIESREILGTAGELDKRLEAGADSAKARPSTAVSEGKEKPVVSARIPGGNASEPLSYRQREILKAMLSLSATADTTYTQAEISNAAFAAVVDISSAIRALREKGLVDSQPGLGTFLTPKGVERAERLAEQPE